MGCGLPGWGLGCMFWDLGCGVGTAERGRGGRWNPFMTRGMKLRVWPRVRGEVFKVRDMYPRERNGIDVARSLSGLGFRV
jgi:hypothetical protein